MIKGNKHSYSRIYYNTTTKLIIHSSKNFQEFELCTFWKYNEQILPKNTQICKIISGGTVLTKLQMTVFQIGGQSNQLILPESVLRLSTEKLVLKTTSKSSKSCEIYVATLVFFLSRFVQKIAGNNNNSSLSSLLCFARHCFARVHLVINLKMCSP